MKRDMDLLREIAFAIEEQAPLQTASLRFDGYTLEQVGYHCRLILEANLAAGTDLQTLRDSYPVYRIERLTMSGHDFVDAARNDAVWRTATQSISERVDSVSFGVLLQLLNKEAAEMLGLDE